MKHKWFFLLLITSFLAQQCAKQTAPTGGPKDETPPKMVRSNPGHKEVNFKGGELELSFNELIQLNNPREQILITPTIGKKFEATAKKNKVILKLNSELQDSTTYTINFRESVQDLTEKNPAKIKLAFSTGPSLDSLFLTGIVKDILNDKEVSNYTVALTPASDTFNIFKHSAPWITLTNKQGKFTLENLKQGSYFIYAFDDKNKNLIVDSKNEKYGFRSDVISLPETQDSIKIQVFKLDATKLKLLSSRPTFAYYNIRLSKSISSYKLSATFEKLYSTIEPDKASIKVYNTIPDLDSLQIRLEASDSSDNKIDTLIYLKFQKKESTKDRFSSKIEKSDVYETNSTLSGVITFSKPIVLFNKDSLFIQVDSLKRTSFSENELGWNQSLTKLTIRKKIEIQKSKESKQGGTVLSESKPTKSYNQIVLTKGSAISVENDSTSELRSPLKAIQTQNFGIISTKVNTKENFILQLIDKNNQLIEEVMNTPTYNFENVQAGIYILRVLIDKNKNGKWDAGNFLNRNQPEPVLFYTNPKGGKEIILKANWLVGSLLITE